jgi:lysophospholipase L1-like esterase
MAAVRPISSMNQVTGLYGAVWSGLRHNRVALLGDSITEGVGSTSLDYPEFMNAYLGSQVLNAGVGGDTLGQMLARIDDVVNFNPSVCVILGGTNNCGSDAGVASAIATVPEITESLLNSGIRPVWCLVMPRSLASSNTRLKRLNRAIVSYCYDYGLTVIDTFSPFADSSGNYNAAYFTDGLHPNQLGYKLIADTVYQGLGISISPATMQLLPGEDTFAPNGNLTADSNGDGLADGFSVSVGNGGAYTASLEANPLGGNWQKISKTAGSNSNSYVQAAFSYSTMDYTAGDKIDIAVDIKTSSSLNGSKVYGIHGIGTDTRLFSDCTVPLTSSVRFQKTVTVVSTVSNAQLLLTIYGPGNADLYIGRILFQKRPTT